MRPRISRSSRPVATVLDLFAGCGGLTEGLASARNREARLFPVAAVELDPAAAATYAANFGPHVSQTDIGRWIDDGNVTPVDVVVGGPPCQGFSALGRQDPDDERNQLWERYVQAVQKANPYYFVLENVPPFLRSQQFQDLRDRTLPGGDLDGYTLWWDVVVASDYGAAQRRRRAVVIGHWLGMPAPDLGKFKRPARTVQDVIGGLPFEGLSTGLERRTQRVRVRNGDLDAIGVYTTEELHITRNVTELSRERYRHIPKGGNRFDLPDRLLSDCWRRHSTGSGDVMGRLRWEAPSVTIRTEFFKPEKGRYLHPVADRPISHAEAAYLQGFTPGFRWCGNKVEIARQIGNAVPVALGHAIGLALLDAFERSGIFLEVLQSGH